MKTGNIVIVGNSPFRPSGGGILADHLLRLLPSAGHAVRAIYPIYGDKSAWPGLIHRRYPQVEVFWYEMPYLADVFAGIAAEDLALQAQGITAGLRRFVASQRPDLIYLHKESSIWGMPALLRELELPLLSTPHGNLLAMVNGATENTQAGEWLETYRQADLITCCAEHMTVRLRAAGLTDLVTVPNGVELERFRPRPRPPALAAELGVAADDIVVLHASDPKAIRRPLDVVRGFAEAFRHDRQLRLLFVGVSFTQQSRDALTAEAKRLGIAERVKITSWVEPRAMPDYYALAGITVQASASEGLSLSCLESMASGRTLIASDIVAARGLVRDGVEGMLFPLGYVGALARAIQAAAADRALRARLGAAARARVAADFSLNRMHQRLLGAIDRLL